MDYDLELSRIVSEIRKLSEDGRPTQLNFVQLMPRRHAALETADRRPIKVCLQFPDGLKAEATRVVKELDRRLKTEDLKSAFFIWAGSNFGGCDYPWYLKDLGFDLLVNFGHAVFKKWPDSA